MKERDNIVCPFCKDDGFDLYGLKIHLTMRGWCEPFRDITEENQNEYSENKS